jgi:hypothetical protein
VSVKPGGLSTEDRARGQASAVRANLATQAITYLVTADVMVLFTRDVLHLSAAQITSALALMPLCALLRLPLLGLLECVGKTRLIRAGTAVRAAVITVLMVLPYQNLTFPLYLGLLVVYSLAQEFTIGVAWQPLMREITTSEDRGRFFGRMRFAFCAVALVVTALVTVLIGSSMTGDLYRLLLGLCLIGLLNQYLWTGRIPGDRVPFTPHAAGEPTSVRGATGSLRACWRVLRRDHVMRIPLLAFVLFQTTVFPLYALYLTEVLGARADAVTVYVAGNALGTTLANPLFGKVLDRVGPQRFLRASAWAGAALCCVHTFAPPFGHAPTAATVFIGCYGLLAGAFQAAGYLGLTALQHQWTSRNSAVLVMNVYFAATVTATAALTWLLGLYMQHVVLPVGSRPWWHGADVAPQIDALKAYYLLVCAPLLLLGAALVRRLPTVVPCAEPHPPSAVTTAGTPATPHSGAAL